MQTNAVYGPVTRHIIKTYNAWQQATTPVNVVMAFQRSGLNSTWSQEDQTCYVTAETKYATKVRHYQQKEGFLVERDRRRTAL